MTLALMFELSTDLVSIFCSKKYTERKHENEHKNTHKNTDAATYRNKTSSGSVNRPRYIFDNIIIYVLYHYTNLVYKLFKKYGLFYSILILFDISSSKFSAVGLK